MTIFTRRAIRRATAVMFAGASLASLGVAAEAKDLTRVGVTVVDLGNPFFGAIGNAVEAAAKEIAGKNVEVILASGDYDLNKQSTQFDNFIQAGVDMIIVSPVDSKAIGAAVERTKAAGIVVVAVDNTALGAQATVTTDNVEAGRQACGYLAKTLGDKGDVIIINGPAVSGVIDRVKGCHEVLDAKPGVKILSEEQRPNGTREGGLTTMSALLTKFDHVDGVFAINDPQAIGADLAGKQVGRNEFKIVTVDGSPDIVDALKGNTLVIASSAQLPGQLAKTALEAGAKLLAGETLAQPDILVAPSLVTRDNVADYRGW